MKNILGKYTGFVPVGGFCWNFHPFANSTIWGLAIKLQEWLYCSWIPKEGNVKECSNYHTIALISLASKVMLKILQARFQQYMNHELPGVQVGFRKSRRTRDQIANIHWIVEKERVDRNIYFWFIDYIKDFVWITTNCGIFLKRWEYYTTRSASWEICMHVKKQQLEPDMKQWTRSKLGKEYIKAISCHPVYLTYMQSTSCKVPAGWSTSWNQDCWENYQ